MSWYNNIQRKNAKELDHLKNIAQLPKFVINSKFSLLPFPHIFQNEAEFMCFISKNCFCTLQTCFVIPKVNALLHVYSCI